MNFKKLGLVLCATAAFGLVACGDDSSSSANESGSSKSDVQLEYEELQKDLMKAMEELGECTEKKEGDEKTVTALGKDYKVVCEDGEWESDELDELVEEYEKKFIEDAEKHIEGKGCNFKMDDKVWSYEIITDLYDGGTAHTISLEINGTTTIEKSVSSVKNPNAQMACKYMSDDDKHTKEVYGDETIETFIECDDDEIVTTDKVTTKNAINDDFTKKEAFDEFMEGCKIANGIKDEDDGDDDDVKKKDDEGDDDEPVEQSSSSSEDPDEDEPVEPASSSSDDSDEDEPVEPAVEPLGIACDIDMDKDVWTVMLSGDDEASMQYLYEFTETDDGEVATVYIVNKTDMGDEATCKQMLELFSTPGSCDGSFLISKTEYRTYEINSDEDRKELYDSVKSTYCKD